MEGSGEKVAVLWLKETEGAEMTKKTMPVGGLPEGFVLTEKKIAWVDERYPSVNIERTLERFTESALANGRMYADWQAAFRTWVRNAVENKWSSGVEFKKGREQDPAWMPILGEVRPYGFRAPMPHETPGSYRTEFNMWKDKQKRAASPVIDFGSALKKMGQS